MDELPRSDDADRRDRLRRVFGDVLPASTADDQEPDGTDAGRHDHWLRQNRPPHHDRD